MPASLFLCQRTSFSASFWWLKHFLEKPTFQGIPRLEKSTILLVRRPTFPDLAREINHVCLYDMHFHREALSLGCHTTENMCFLTVHQAALFCNQGFEETRKVLADLWIPSIPESNSLLYSWNKTLISYIGVSYEFLFPHLWVPFHFVLLTSLGQVLNLLSGPP